MSSGSVDPQTFLQQCTEQSPLIEAVRIGQAVLAGTGELVRSLTDARQSLVVGDENSFAVAGPQIVSSLKAAGLETTLQILPCNPLPVASVRGAEPICQALVTNPDIVPVAIGSGVVNDLVKYAAFKAERRYVSVATAASMDGYLSAGAPLEKDGFKITIPARPPIAMIADITILGSAPLIMNAWGYGDLAGKIPAGADWILADALGIEPINERSWSLVQDNLRDWLSKPAGIASGDMATITRLFTGLTAAGFAMEAHGTSRPASGTDHQIAHIWEMEGVTVRGSKLAHGAAVAVGTVITLALYDWLLTQDLTTLDCVSVLGAAPDLGQREQHLRTVISEPAIADRAFVELVAKHPDPATHAARLERVAGRWNVIQARLMDYLLPAAKMVGMLQEAGAPVSPGAIAVSAERLVRTLNAALYIRRRYTILDFLHETGLLPAAIRAVVQRLASDTPEAP